MKQLLSAIILVMLSASCNTDYSGNRQSSSSVKRFVRAVHGMNTDVKLIRYIDSSYKVGDTVLVNMEGISRVNKAVIVQ